jgi:hypothetical protein
MNFKDYEKDLQRFLRINTATKSKTKEYHRGIYLISRNVNDNTHKIGMAWGKGGLFNRLRSYKICMPYKDEFYVQLLIICPTIDDAKLLEKRVLKRKELGLVEANETAQGRRSLEYKVTESRAQLNTAVRRTLDRNPNLWTHVIVFNNAGWKVIPNTGHAVKGMERPSLRRTKQPGLYESRQKTTFDLSDRLPTSKRSQPKRRSLRRRL